MRQAGGPGDLFDSIPPPGREVTQPDLSLLTKGERNDIAYYTSSFHAPINSALRKGREATALASVRRAIKNIDSGLARYPLPYAVRATRGMRISAFGVQSPDDLAAIVGQTVAEPGYMSTSLDRQPPWEFLGRDSVVLDIAVPRGTPALVVRDISAFPGENELLIQRGRVLNIVAAVYDGSVQRWRVRTVMASE